jgi:hypothetical protein
MIRYKYKKMNPEVSGFHNEFKMNILIQ